MGLGNGLLALDSFVLKVGSITSAVDVGTVGVGESGGSLLHVLQEGLGVNSHFVDFAQEEQYEFL